MIQDQDGAILRMVRSFALSMSTWFKGVVVAIALAVAPSAVAESSEAGLVKELRGAPDFRVRVQAALQLGKLKSDGARTALEAALNDKEESVRAAAAGGLKKIGDKRSLAALQRHREDESEAVQRQVADALKSLGGAAKSAKKPKLLVQLGDMQNTTAVKSEKALQALRETSRQKLDELPEVGVVDTAPKSSEGKLPVVLMTGRIERLKMSRDGSDVIYSARVEYILYRMPGRAITAMLSGSASARTTADEAQDKKRAAELREAVLDAAISRAMRDASQALVAAAAQ